jgi:hypothetical protein
MNRIYFFVAILITTLFSSCTYDYTDHSCEPIICGQVGGPVYYYDLNQVDYAYPVFNPNDNAEFTALRIVRGNDTTIQQVSLVKVNYTTNVSQTLMTHAFMQTNNISISDLSWSTTGWIAFRNANNNQIYKISDSGVGLQQMTSGTGRFNPSFTYDGTKLFFSDLSSAYTMDINTAAYIDTVVDANYIGPFSYAASFSNNWMITAKDDNEVRVLDGNTLTLVDQFTPTTSIANFDHLNHFDNLSLSTSQVIFSCTAGICKLNIVDHSVILIKESCVNKKISWMRTTPDGTKIIYQLDKLEVPNESCSIRQQTEIHIMDINGSDDQKLILP